MLRSTLVLVTVLIGFSDAKSVSRIIDCKILPDGNYEIRNAGCDRRHIECYKGLRYDHSAGRCEQKENVSACENQNKNVEPTPDPNAARNEWFAWRKGFNDDHLCINKTDGLHDLRGPCSKYYIRCDGGKGLLDMCTGNNVFGFAEQGCGDDEKIFSCATIKLQVPPCEVLPAGRIYGKEKGNLYFECKGPHVSLRYNCKEGFGFSPEKEKCIHLEEFS